MLNPAIYSAHLKLHPLLVLSALVVAEHSLGVWGLLLAVPLTVFALDYLIRWVDRGCGRQLRIVMQARCVSAAGGGPGLCLTPAPACPPAPRAAGTLSHR